ncbi:DNA methyltransferase [uncultured Methanobrevibacter sp.]|uniref:DNA methyltransferase n=1 Tax=uncultured Methanobrevibacter sp. TaxID=253161 RepID=UPI0032099905
MANIQETISEVAKLDTELARQIQKFVKDHSYGLVFENNLPEGVRLYKKAVSAGDVVNIFPPRGQFEKEDNFMPWVVKNIKDGVATIEHDSKTKNVNVDDLVVTVSYRDVIYPGLREIDRVERGNPDDPYHMIINAENYHALEALAYAYAGKVDCIYIDPPYNKLNGKDWKYNCNYIDPNDQYRHSKWLAFMERRLKLAKQLLNPNDSVIMVTVDEVEYARLGLLLEQMFPEAQIQMITNVINPRGVNREGGFSRVEEYIYMCRIGDSQICKFEDNMLGNTDEVGKARVWYAFNRGNNPRSESNNQFYPIYIDESTRRIVEIGEPMDLDYHPEDFPIKDDLISVFPINDRGEESIWRCVSETAREWVDKGYVKVSQYDKKNDRWTLSYMSEKTRNKIESGEIVVDNKLPDGSLDIKYIDDSENENVSPNSVWFQKQHNATDYGSKIIKKIIPGHHFQYPKSLYAVRDTLSFFVKDKKDALIIDFFAGSGTTLHAVNLLNAEDGGHRRCICITNNDVSAKEEKKFTRDGLRPTDWEWEKHGIAYYITWPRTKCSIEGVDVNGNPLKGKYGYDAERYQRYEGDLCNPNTRKKIRNTLYKKNKEKLYPELSKINMSDGFKANAIFCELTYESAWPIRLDHAFNAIAPILWMQAGCRGPIIHRIDKSYLTTEYYGVLFDYNQASKFCEKVKNTPSIKTVFVVTDDQRRYSNMCRRLPEIEVHRLYETYLRTFEIGGEGSLD